jgi:hypothetical protein
MAPAGLGELIDDGTGRLVRGVMRAPRAGLQTGPALLAVLGEDGVAGLPADPEAGAERGEGKHPELEISDEE